MRKLFLDVFADSGQTFANSQRHDPYKNFNFSVDFIGRTGIHKSGWSQVGGVKLRNDFTTYKEGGNNGVADQIHSDTTFEPITMRRGMSESFDLVKAISNSYSKSGIGITNDAKMDIIIKIKDRDGKRVVRTIYLRDAWISAYEMGDLNAMGSEVLFESLTVSFTGVDY